jgi:glycosyltransferase involved in cell wall biosynthesis
MGELVAAADAGALAQGIKKVLRNPGQYDRPRSDIEALFSQQVIAEKYEDIYGRLIRGNQNGQTV